MVGVRGAEGNGADRCFAVPGSAEVTSVIWETGPLGKPFLRTEAGDDGLEFSWSQAGTAVVIAVAQGIPVGVDACQESDGESLDGLADVFCSEDEASCAGVHARGTSASGRLCSAGRPRRHA